MAVMITDEIAFVGAVPVECGGWGVAGRTSGDHGKAEVLHKGADGMFIKVLDLMVGPAEIEEKPYHSIVSTGCGVVLFFIYPSGICIIFIWNVCGGG